MKYLLCSFLLFIAGFCTAGMTICLNGTPACTIVSNKDSEAAKELKLHLDSMTGSAFSIVDENSFQGGGSAIYIGDTLFARKNGFDFTNFKPDQWICSSIGDSLVIGGCSEYGVWNFLEMLGCRWFTFESTLIPQKKTIVLDDVDLKGCSPFWQRMVLTPCDVHDMPQQPMLKYERRNRGTSYGGNTYRLSRQTPPHHNFYYYVNPDLYFKEHPEYFGMDQSGRRMRGNSSRKGGQLCLSNKEVLNIALESLRKFINEDREKFADAPDKCPNMYDFSQNDTTSYICCCPECRKITKAEGSEAGLIIWFMNKMLDRLAVEYPGIMLRTFAYNSTEKAPKHIRPHKKLLIQYCDLYSKSDCYRPLTHTVNRDQLSILKGWSALGARMAIWDYWNMGSKSGTYFNPPRVETIVDAIASDIRTFRECGIEAYFGEAEAFFQYVPQNFYDLHKYLAYKMLETPERDEEGIILDFMQGHYGPAAKPMIEFLDYLRKCVREQKEPMFYMANFKHYQTADFMGKAYRLLHQARQMTKPDSQYRLRVEKEMIAPLGVLLSHRGMDIGIPRDKLKAEYISYRKGQIERYCFPEKRKKLLKELEDSLIDIPIPDQFKEFPEDKIRVLAYPSFPQLKADSEAVLGKAMLISYSLSSDRQHLMKKVKGHYPTSFGLYDWQDKRGIDFTIPMPPDDEKYHWYKIGDFEIGSATALWGWWWLSRVNVATVYDNADGLPPGHNRWTVWIHIKVTGPAYVAGSTMENEILMDQIVLHK